ncbi:MAG TPA: response regulator [Patescibacteria group bacterium]|nr:response regulator [Patescibacteria group bacterium]
MDFFTVRTVIGEPDPAVRECVCSALLNAEFAHIIACPSLLKLHQTIRREGADLLILNASMDGEDTSFITTGIRSGKLGRDPFTIIIVLMATTDTARARSIADSGADDALLLPVASDVLIKKVTDLSGPRKPFVVTCDYIGPERRATPRPNRTSAMQIEVPNPLAGRRGDGYAAVRDASRERVFMERTARLAAQIGWLIDAIGEAVIKDEPIVPFLFRLDQVGKELAECMAAPEWIERIRRLLALARAIRISQTAVSPNALAELTAAAGVIRGVPS